MDKSKYLGEESIGKLLLQFSVPAIIGMLVNALYNIVDRFFVGNKVGLLAISAITVAFPITLIIMAFGMLVGVGAASTISIKLGQNKKTEAEHILSNALILLIIISALITIIGLIFIEPLLRIFGASADVMPYAKQYVSIILLVTVLQNIGFGLNNVIRSEGNPKIAMTTMIIGGILNIILNPIFIFALNTGIRGSAIATAISQTVSSVWVLHYFLKGKSLLKFKVKYMLPNWNITKQIFAIGMSPFLLQLVSSSVTIILNNSLKTFGGDTAIAAMGIINSVVLLIFMPIFGINQGAQPIIGYNYGAQNYSRVKRTLKYSIIAAVSISTTGFIIVQLFSQDIIRFFNNTNPDLISIGSLGMKILLAALPLAGFQVVGSNYFEAVNKATKSILLSLSRQVIILIPLIIILPRFLKLNGVWIAGASSDLIAALLTAVFIFREIRRLQSLDASITSKHIPEIMVK